MIAGHEEDAGMGRDLAMIIGKVVVVVGDRIIGIMTVAQAKQGEDNPTEEEVCTETVLQLRVPQYQE
jgi:hypothetical protein